MFRLTKSFRFEAAHFLPNHDGKCRNLHGHSWVVHLTVQGESLHAEGPKKGMLVDFGVLGNVCKSLHNQLDHKCLNDIEGLDNPTSEVLALWIHDRVVGELPELACVAIEETCTCRCEYWSKQ